MTKHALGEVEFSFSALSKLRAARKAATEAYAWGDRQRGDLLAEDYLRLLRDEFGCHTWGIKAHRRA